MKLFSSNTYQARRNKLKSLVGNGQILLFGNIESPMNYKDNTYRFRQDSSFLYFFGLNIPGLIALIDIDKNEEYIFGDEYTLDDIIWMGPQEKLKDLALKVGINHVNPFRKVTEYLNLKDLNYLPLYRHNNKIYLSQLLSVNTKSLVASEKLIKAVVACRSYKTPEEIVQMTDAVNITKYMHLAAMQNIKPDMMEFETMAEILKAMHIQNAELAYPVIFSVNGQTLHNHNHGNKMLAGQLALNDSGAENCMAYAGDITRTMPVSGKFTTQQKEIYDTVLKMEVDSISMLKPGLSYKDVHVQSNRILIESLKNIGILSGDVDVMLAEGVGGLFMPHGLGHMIGLDVHDMEDLGEKYVGYNEGQERSIQMGLKSLRLAKELEAGYVLTVEPGCYFIPELIDKYKSEGMFKEWVNYEKLEAYKSFGGVRIEDNILITEMGSEILGDAIPKTTEEVEGEMGR